MSFIEALVLGIVEGLTEYLPVSSTGHLILAQRLMGIEESEAANAYAVCIQLGAIVAVLGLYRRRIAQIARGVLGRDGDGRRLAQNLVIAFIPAAFFGFTLGDWIESRLFGLWPIVGAWLVGGMAILMVSWTGREKLPPTGLALEQLSRRGALAIGLIQCLAMWPGVSRSLVTIVGAVLVGMGLPAAVEFSFLLGLLTLGAATAYKALQHGPLMLEAYGPETIAAGFLAAAISATLAVKWMVAYLNKHGLSVFGYYRVLIALIVGAMLLMGWL